MRAEEWDARYAAHDLVWSFEPNAMVAKLLSGPAPTTAKRALDLGAGEGRNAIWLAAQGWEVTAVDFSPVAISKAAQLADDAGVDVTWVTADVLSHPLEPLSWDLVLLAFLQIPNPARLDVLRRSAAAVAPGGRLLVVAHDQSNVADGYGGPPDPSVCYTVEETVSVLAGFDVETAEVLRRSVATPDGERTALDTLVFATRAA